MFSAPRGRAASQIVHARGSNLNYKELITGGRTGSGARRRQESSAKRTLRCVCFGSKTTGGFKSSPPKFWTRRSRRLPGIVRNDERDEEEGRAKGHPRAHQYHGAVKADLSGGVGRAGWRYAALHEVVDRGTRSPFALSGGVSAAASATRSGSDH